MVGITCSKCTASRTNLTFRLGRSSFRLAPRFLRDTNARTMEPMLEESNCVTSVRFTNSLLVPTSISSRNWLSKKSLASNRRFPMQVNDDDIGGMTDRELEAHSSTPPSIFRENFISRRMNRGNTTGGIAPLWRLPPVGAIGERYKTEYTPSAVAPAISDGLRLNPRNSNRPPLHCQRKHRERREEHGGR